MTHLCQTIAATIVAALVFARRWLEAPRRDERGSVTLEHVLWAILVLVLVGLAGAAITNFLNSKTGVLQQQ
ncbi:hypothetical protein [Brooklawnia sp.]|uniref:hypothetical protein n=1 Tax=Brooklawnia sp. TaxID=2699740 RepID=UPI00311F760F